MSDAHEPAPDPVQVAIDRLWPQLDRGRQPFELFVLVLGLVVGWPLLLGAPTPGSTTELLGPVWARVWAWILVIGCLIALIGVWWTWWNRLQRWFPRISLRTSTGLLIEQVGLVAVGVGTLIYAIGVVSAAGGDTGRFVPAGLVAGLGMACVWRAGQIQRWVRATIASTRRPPHG